MSSHDFDWKAFLKKYGYYAVSFQLAAANSPTLPELAEWMRTDSPRYTGWPPFWWPTHPASAPQVINQDTYECIHPGTSVTGAIERWRASTNGHFTIIRAYDSDRDEAPGKYVELTMPPWRISELLLYAGRMAERFTSPTVDFTLRFEGLAGRLLRASWSPARALHGHYETAAAHYGRRVELASADIDTGVIEMTDGLIRGLYDLFQFTLPGGLYEAEITRMRSNRY